MLSRKYVHNGVRLRACVSFLGLSFDFLLSGSGYEWPTLKLVLHIVRWRTYKKKNTNKYVYFIIRHVVACDLPGASRHGVKFLIARHKLFANILPLYLHCASPLPSAVRVVIHILHLQRTACIVPSFHRWRNYTHTATWLFRPPPLTLTLSRFVDFY